jgi:hypothetical protein
VNAGLGVPVQAVLELLNFEEIADAEAERLQDSVGVVEREVANTF